MDCDSECLAIEDGNEDALTDEQRWQVNEARFLLAKWDIERNPDGDIYSTERTLADQLRGMLAVIDQLAPVAED